MGDFAKRLLRWWDRHGRHDLPWQGQRDPYRVWVAEIMLQQTQAATVCAYYPRFLERFPTVQSLAAATLDEVLALWSGLGYYARARNLHRAARVLVDEHRGRFPEQPEGWMRLPGIGRSTAAAIVAQAWNRRAVILDGNVRRVLARHALIDEWPGRARVERKLWEEAERRTPGRRVADYTQAIMDLGATVCTRHRPACERCPVAGDCGARAADQVARLPTPRPRARRRERSARFMILSDPSGRVLLQRRPPAGIWGGLWCLPEPDEVPQIDGHGRLRPTPAPLRHPFTHFVLLMSFEHRRVQTPPAWLQDRDDWQWFALDELDRLGLPEPIRRVLGDLDAASDRQE